MKYKLLLAGKSFAIIDDFFLVMNEEFECLTTSLRSSDILNHVRCCQPDAFVYCMSSESSENMQKVVSVLGSAECKDINFFLIGDSNSCDEFLKIKPEMVDLTLERPILASSIREEIVKYFAAQREEAEAAIQAQREAEEAAMRAQREAAEAAKQAQAQREVAMKHILVIDDDPLMLRVIKEKLKDEFNVATAISGKIGLNFLQRKKTDLILLDYEMPEENGPMVLEKLRANEATKDIPVVFLTGISEREKIKQVIAMKPQGYLLKPIEHDKLIQAIYQVIG